MTHDKMTFDNKRLYDDILSFLSVKYPKYVTKTPLRKTVEINKNTAADPELGDSSTQVTDTPGSDSSPSRSSC